MKKVLAIILTMVTLSCTLGIQSTCFADTGSASQSLYAQISEETPSKQKNSFWTRAKKFLKFAFWGALAVSSGSSNSALASSVDSNNALVSLESLNGQRGLVRKKCYKFEGPNADPANFDCKPNDADCMSNLINAFKEINMQYKNQIEQIENLKNQVPHFKYITDLYEKYGESDYSAVIKNDACLKIDWFALSSHESLDYYISKISQPDLAIVHKIKHDNDECWRALMYLYQQHNIKTPEIKTAIDTIYSDKTNA